MTTRILPVLLLLFAGGAFAHSTGASKGHCDTEELEIEKLMYEAESSAWMLGISIGATSWPALADVSSSEGGSFDSTGLELGISAYRKSGQWLSQDLYVGVELGLSIFESSIAGSRNNLSQTGLYLAPSARLRMNGRSAAPWFLEAGAGWYNAEIVEYDCEAGFACYVDATQFASDTTGGFFGVRYGGSAFVNLRVHFVDHGRVRWADSVAGDLNGPFFVLAGGFTF